ncbi:irregular chiasm C-roughest protein-like [Mya arenaria]|uniref:irregular chiasm C-roughest protein-like n=1 Tax=Mya arenaria TaxID=6604 RepID=UPI0022DFBB7A|nr:irregular chiasm C-roughest protein-like [Mya arenaria]XP_052805323.1 irregular chiasm C-roughest protein-like [Mya arenaria]XP_052805324.1 irregular chiasm C-roughest protein-like [Mya arenaria]XP_052805325.1 irregular chiasm C-roughest protein-like [Mya arenaria]XP_052805326.1 irregular chiasm C-roughest protein-like [Mya arenaria]XP_052805327.1 irregular chiasm C-roughest protein-like [Mya arenaria]XP_052805328.1 irregular chiasm C-roughest protein-like [Mya arenaria]
METRLLEPMESLISAFVLITFLQTALGAQEFYRQPTHESAVQGSSIVLRCIIKNRDGTVQWTHGGFGLGTERNLPGYDRYTMIGNTNSIDVDGNSIEEYSLKIDNLQLIDDTNYTCQVSPGDSDEGIISNMATVTVLVPPSPPILSGKVTIPVTLEKPTNVTCDALNGKPKAQITWKKDDVRIMENTYELTTTQPDGKRVDTRGIVTITAQPSDAGKKIECGAWNMALKEGEPLWTQATLDVQYAPKLTLTHSNPDRTIREVDEVKFTCSGEANPFQITWRWYRNGELQADVNGYQYTIPRITRDFHGQIIRCEAENSVGTTAVEHSLNILYGPKFKGDPAHVSVDQGERAELVCEAEGNPTAEITWRRQNKYSVLHTGSIYVIPSVREGMFGVYTCTATVLGFHEISRDIYVTENGPPQITSDATQYASIGDRAMIQCLSISSPKPIFVWSRNSQPIDYASSGRFSAPEEGLPFGGKSSLQILDVQEEDFGIYNCTVINTKGSATLMIKLEKSEEVQMAVIIGSAVGGVAVIFIIVIACIIYYKCRHSDNESYAETDSNTEIKKRDKNESPSEMTKSTLMDQWRQDYNYRYSAEFDDVDAKVGNTSGQYVCYDTERYGTMPTNHTNGHLYGEGVDDLGPLNRFENSYSTGYIPSTFRSPSRTDFTSGRVSANELASGRTSVNDFTSGRVSATDFTSGRVSTTDFSGRASADLVEPFRLPTADNTTSKLATNV